MCSATISARARKESERLGFGFGCCCSFSAIIHLDTLLPFLLLLLLTLILSDDVTFKCRGFSPLVFQSLFVSLKRAGKIKAFFSDFENTGWAKSSVITFSETNFSKQIKVFLKTKNTVS